METFIIKAAQLVLALALLVIIHEFGHYFFARVFGIKVEKFYLFFNPWFSLFKYKPKKGKVKLNRDGSERPTWRDTEYGIGWLPLGGYCKIAGMIDESMDTEQMAKDPEPWEFRAKPAYQRLLVMVGGVLFNFILAIIIYSGIVYCWGERTIKTTDVTEGFDFVAAAQEIGFRNGDIPLLADGDSLADQRTIAVKMIEADTVTVMRRGVGEVKIAIPDNFVFRLNDDKGFFSYRFPVQVKSLVNGQPAAEAGMEVGDRVTAVGGTPTPSFTEFTAALDSLSGVATTITVTRDGSTVTMPITPTDGGKIGIGLAAVSELYNVTVINHSLLQSIPQGVEIGVNTLVNYVSSLKYLFTKEGATSMGGFGAIGGMFPNTWNWLSFWEITALLSVILAFMNIIPIPALDGGHVMFVLYEIITRRKPNEKFLEYAQMTGMILLFMLLIYANGLDLVRAFL